MGLLSEYPFIQGDVDLSVLWWNEKKHAIFSKYGTKKQKIKTYKGPKTEPPYKEEQMKAKQNNSGNWRAASLKYFDLVTFILLQYKIAVAVDSYCHHEVAHKNTFFHKSMLPPAIKCISLYTYTHILSVYFLL